MNVYDQNEYNEDDDSDNEARDDIRNRYVITSTNDGDEEERDELRNQSISSSAKPRSSSIFTSESIHFKNADSNNKPGYAYIFNHVNFINLTCERRLGSEKDVKELEDTFEKLGMSIETINDADVQTIKDTVAKIAAKDFSQTDYLVFAILSYGEKNNIILAKNGTYSIYDTILFKLRNDTLEDKPKILFVQSCKKNENEKKLSDGATSKPSPRYQLPENILIFYGSFEGLPLHAHEAEGTFFIQSLCNLLRKHGMVEDIKNVFKKLKEDLKKYNQTPYHSGTLVGRFCFGDYTRKTKNQ